MRRADPHPRPPGHRRTAARRHPAISYEDALLDAIMAGASGYGSASYAGAIRQGAPEAVQVSDRWRWHGLARAAEKAVAAHSTCWAKAGPKRQELARERTTLERWHAIHDLIDNSVGLLDCARRLSLALNTVKRYARAPEPDRLRRPPQYGACLVDPYRDHLRRRRRRAEEPSVSVKHLFEEIRALGYSGSLNLLHKYLNQGRLEGDRIIPVLAASPPGS